MGSFSLWHWLVVIILVLLLFGRGRISDMMGDIGKGLKSFKQGMADEDSQPAKPPEQRRLPEEPIDVTPEQRRPSETAPPPSDDTTSRH
ncbi:MAG TPA: twin-arginine translocase TatA/TatE family subunit [Sphingomicrobium sp.]|nr:twin-arginine translocase TatA/TatE family subunit [Sphingomicrobium sp.]